jgi:apolipoprotein N-acyltransferase
MSKATAEDETPESAAVGSSLRPELQQIIADGRRKAPEGRGSLRSATLLAAGSMLLLWASFTPIQLGALAWVALVPLIQLLRLHSLPRHTTWVLWLLGTLWSLATLQWMRLGHPAMYMALVALSLYVGLYLPVFVRLSRGVIRGGLPLWLTVPVVWTTLEYLRAWMLTGFSWYYLGHSQYRWSALTQISDLTGAYGVSFVVALASAALALQVPQNWLRRIGLEVADSSGRGRWTAPVVAVTLLIAACIYGNWRLRTAPTDRPGPVMALVQGNFTPDDKHDGSTIMRRYRRHEELTLNARNLQPDVIVWPETMFPWPMKVVAEGVTDEQLVDALPAQYKSRPGSDRDTLVRFWRNADVEAILADQSRLVGAAMVVGLETTVVRKDGLDIYNSAAFVRPDLGYSGRFDKMHLVLFGEYIPLRDIFPWLASFSPYGSDFGLDSGTDPNVFEYAGFRLSPLICFEDTVPHLVRRVANTTDAAGKTCDVLVNLTNDAWFRGSSELDQHLITATFRCIETRRPMVRAVNGGISAFIDGSGRVREPDQIQVVADESVFNGATMKSVEGMVDPATGRWRRQFSGVLSGQLPLDGRESFYLKFGDWFCWLCSATTIVAMLMGWRGRRVGKTG